MKQPRVKHLSQFLAWCRERASPETCSQYERYLARPLNPNNRWSVTAWKRYYRFLCEEKGDKRACEEFSKIRSKRSGSDLWVPPDSEIRRALESPLGWLYSLLIQSGLRFSELVRILEEADRLEWYDGEGYSRVLLAWKRGSKRAFWGYFLQRVEPRPVSPDRLQDMRQALGLPGFKYMRKWAATKMYEAGCGEAEVDFIQGRTPDSVLRKHYLMIIGKADECYKRYAAWLRGWLVEL
ncbi:MAG: hypothetical protein F7C34_03585 [Desulfurococcales archaeon]|nr:hypothetical protein [Desulfurococcales archaeon]